MYFHNHNYPNNFNVNTKFDDAQFFFVELTVCNARKINPHREFLLLCLCIKLTKALRKCLINYSCHSTLKYLSQRYGCIYTY